MDSDYFHDVINLPGERPTMFVAGGHGSPQYWDQPGGVQGRIYRSEDGGQSWRQVGAGLPAKHAAMCWQLAYNPYYKDSIFAAFGDVARGHTAGPPGQGAIYVTHDRGDTWEEVALQKRGTKWLQPPAIRVLWAAADE
jgi:hypothetical protein